MAMPNGDSRLRLIAAIGLVAGAVLRIAGTFLRQPSFARWHGAWTGVATTFRDSRLPVRGRCRAVVGVAALVSVSRAMPRLVSGLGTIAVVLFAVVAVRIFSGTTLTPLSRPLPFFAHPFLGATLLGGARAHYRGRPASSLTSGEGLARRGVPGASICFFPWAVPTAGI